MVTKYSARFPKLFLPSAWVTMNDYGDLDSPSWCKSIVEEDNEKLFQERSATVIDNDRDRDNNRLVHITRIAAWRTRVTALSKSF